jgi:hypothetical protein
MAQFSQVTYLESERQTSRRVGARTTQVVGLAARTTPSSTAGEHANRRQEFCVGRFQIGAQQDFDANARGKSLSKGEMAQGIELSRAGKAHPRAGEHP